MLSLIQRPSFLIGLLAAWSITLSMVEAQEPTHLSRPLRTAVIEVYGPIDSALFNHFRAKLAAARREGCELVILEIESPGGLLEESLEMGRLLQNVDWATTVAYVPKQALSGAAILSLGADRIVLGPQGRFGDAGVISMDEAWFFQYVEAKVLSDVVRQVRDLAESQGHAPELAEAMVDRHAVVYRRLRADGSHEFTIVYAQDDVAELAITPPAPAIAEGEAAWTLVDESIGNRFLEVNATRAIEIGLAASSVENLDALLKAERADERPLILKRTLPDIVAFWLTRPLIRFLLIVIAMVALYFELSAPGLGAGGVISGLCFIAIFWSSFMSGLGGAFEILLFVTGFVFLMLEFFVIPGFGVAGILGLLMLVCSLVLAGQAFLMPGSAVEWNELTTSLSVTAASGIAFLIAANIISHRIGSVPILNRLVLAPPPPTSQNEVALDGSGKPSTKKHPVLSIGEWGEAESVLRPGGKARFAGGSFDVVADGEYVEPGTAVRIVNIAGNRVVVAADQKTV